MNLLLFKNSLRFLLSRRNYLLINVTGLGIGIASFLILSLYIYNDLTYNHFNKNISNIYRVREGETTVTKGPLLPEMLKEIPEIENGTRIFNWDGFRISYKETAFEENINYVDTGFFSVFSFPFLEGSARTGIHDKYGVVISSEFARKYFGNESAIGKKLQVKFDNIFLQVNGVVDIPANSSVKFDIVGSYETGTEISPWIKDVHDWYNTFSITYVLLRDGTDPSSLNGKLQKIVQENFIPVGENTTKLNLMPFMDYHSAEESNRTLIIILSVIALGILGIAIVNFINLSITSSLSRTREIGIKKVMGASGRLLSGQIMMEALLVSLIALFMGIGLMTLLLPLFNRMFDAQLQFHSSEYKFIFSLLTAIWLIVGISSGLFPSIFWFRARLVQTLHGNIFRRGKKSASRYSLVVVQFVIAIILISGTILIRKQIRYMISSDPKFDKENVIAVSLDSWQYQDLKAASGKFRYISEELKSSPYVESVCFSQCIPGTYNENYNSFVRDGGSNADKISLRQAYVGMDYFKTYGIKILSGDGFDQQLTSYKDCVVLNKTAMEKFGFSEAAGQAIHISSIDGPLVTVKGIADDFSYQGVQRSMQPLVHFFTQREDLSGWDYLSVRSKPGSAIKVIALLKDLWKKTEPSSSVSYFFAIDKINQQYKEYIRINKLIGWFSLLAIILSCLGLIALSSYLLERKTKEIGIRKVNGARIPEVMIMLNKVFIRWVVVAFIIATPVALAGLHKWLQSFAVKTSLSWWIFVAAGAISLFIALLTVSWQSWRAASRNPVEALRYE